MPVTIRDVAKRLNLSITTVSRALDGYDDVADETRQRVIDAAREMGYAPSRMARQLRRRRADAIGFIIPSAEPRFADPSFLEFIAGLGDEATLSNWDLLVSTAAPDSPAEREIYQRWVQTRRVDGIVLSRMRARDWRTEYLTQMSFPFVASGHSLDPIQFPFIEVDGRAGMMVLVAHLVERGYSRIGFIGASPDLIIHIERLAGYREALAAFGIPLDQRYIVQGDLTRPGGFQAAQDLLSLPDPPKAIIGINDPTAIGAMHAAIQCGLTVGEDLAVTGFDGLSDAETVHPSLTTLNQPVYEIGRRLVRMLGKLISAEPLEDQHVNLKPELVIRASSGW